jgi:hypothetical protein
MFLPAIENILATLEDSKKEKASEELLFTITIKEDFHEQVKKEELSGIIYHVFINSKFLSFKKEKLSYLDFIHKMILLYNFPLKTLNPEYIKFYLAN